MPRLMLILILHIFIGSTVAGSAVVLALVTGFDTLGPILIMAALGFLAAFPVSWFVVKRISDTA